MSEIKALEKLREKIRLDVNNPWSDLKGDLLVMCDKLEREIAERYMELPVDAGGVPIHVGDYLESEELGGKRFPCRGLNVEVCGEGKRWTVCTSYDSYSGTSEYGAANRCTHVKPRTLEDVLREFTDAVFRWDAEDGTVADTDTWSELVKPYADEIRELLRGDAE